MKKYKYFIKSPFYQLKLFSLCKYFFLILLSFSPLVDTANTNDQDDDDLDTHAEDDVEEE